MKKTRDYKLISLNLLISYLSILVVPLIAIIIIYFTTNNVLINNQIEKSSNSLATTCANISKSIREASNIAVYISDSTELRHIAEKKKVSFFDLYRYAQSSTEYKLINSNIDNIYIFFNDRSYIIKDKTVVPDEERFFYSLGVPITSDYNSFRDNIINTAYNGNTINMDTDKSIFIVQHFPYKSFDQFKGSVIVKLNDKEISNMLDSSRLDDQGFAIMVENNANAYRIQAKSGNAQDLSSQNLADIIENNRFHKDGVDYVISRAYDEKYNYTYISLIPKQAILSETSYVRSIIIVLSVITFILSLAVCIALWRRRRAVIRRISAYEISDVHVRQPKTFSIWDSISNMLDNISSMQDRIYRQENFINMSFVRKIVLGIYENEDMLLQDMRSVNARLEGHDYIAISAEFKLPTSLALEQGQNLLLIKEAFDKFPYPNLFCELSNGMAAIVLPLPKDFSISKLKNALLQLVDEIYVSERIQSYMGIGKIVNTRVEIASSYEGAKRISDFLYYNDIRTVMSKDDAPEFKDTFFFPIETELQLIKTIKSAKPEDIIDIFRLLQYENFEYRQLSPAMTEHFLDMLKASIIRNFKDDFQIQADEKSEFSKLYSLNDIRDYVLGHIYAIKNTEQNISNSELELKDKIIQIFEKNYGDEQFNISVLSQMLDVSENKLYSQIKSLFGMSFTDYLEQIRINKACELLQGFVPVKDVAKMVGYNSDYSFRRAFKRIMGMPPSYYSEGFKK